ncbi:MAG: hypothetical protein WBQ44_20630 [Rhodococcus sp. (in: high G+C Gram-positive bacteria)]
MKNQLLNAAAAHVSMTCIGMVGSEGTRIVRRSTALAPSPQVARAYAGTEAALSGTGIAVASAAGVFAAPRAGKVGAAGAVESAAAAWTAGSAKPATVAARHRRARALSVVEDRHREKSR